MIKDLIEKKGGARREEPKMELLRDLITELKLVDIPTVNGKFTLNNRRGVAHQVGSRLDRFLVSKDSVIMDVFYKATILQTFGSDH